MAGTELGTLHALTIVVLSHPYDVTNFFNFIERRLKIQLSNLPKINYFIFLTYLSYEKNPAS